MYKFYNLTNIIKFKFKEKEWVNKLLISNNQLIIIIRFRKLIKIKLLNQKLLWIKLRILLKNN